jgi:competence CoiA-like predicted nuclease
MTNLANIPSSDRTVKPNTLEAETSSYVNHDPRTVHDYSKDRYAFIQVEGKNIHVIPGHREIIQKRSDDYQEIAIKRFWIDNPNRTNLESVIDWLQNLAFQQTSTVEYEHPTIEKQLEKLFEAAKDEIFETGTESVFAKKLLFAINWGGDVALDIITERILSESINSEIAWEALRWIGKYENPQTHLSRRRLLERCLLVSYSIAVKDGAILGLAFMDDPEAIPTLEKAREQETNLEFRRDIEQVLEQLKETRAE